MSCGDPPAGRPPPTAARPQALLVPGKSPSRRRPGPLGSRRSSAIGIESIQEAPGRWGRGRRDAGRVGPHYRPTPPQGRPRPGQRRQLLRAQLTREPPEPRQVRHRDAETRTRGHGDVGIRARVDMRTHGRGDMETWGRDTRAHGATGTSLHEHVGTWG